MYSAYGRAVIRHADGSLTIKVEFVNDQTTRTVRITDYTGLTVNDVRWQITQALQDLITSDTDAALQAAVVGQLLGSI